MITLNYRDSRPIYEQVKDGFRRLLISGALLPGDKLPSVRELATQLAINPNTIQRAYRELESEGYIYTQAGRGCFASDSSAAADAEKRVLLERFDSAAQELLLSGLSVDELVDRIKSKEAQG